VSIFWRLLRPEFVRERGTTLLGTTTNSSTSTTITTTRIHTDGRVVTDTTTTVNTPADNDADVDDTSAVDKSYVIIGDGDKFEVLELLSPVTHYTGIHTHVCGLMCFAVAVALLYC
jgi:hypothetical protein